MLGTLRRDSGGSVHDGPTLGELAAAQLGAAARGFDMLWLNGVAAATLRDALAAGQLAHARAIAVELRGDDVAAVRLLRDALPRRDWAYARLGPPSRRLHLFTRRAPRTAPVMMQP